MENLHVLRRDVWLTAAIVAPFMLNDFAFMIAKTAPQWLAVDYGSKLIALGFLFFIPRLREAVGRTIRLKGRVGEGLILAGGCAAAIIAADAVIFSLDNIFPEQFILFRFPEIKPPLLHGFDLTVGLVLTAISEELVFRGALGAIMRRYTNNRLLIIMLSSVVFALIHWGTGFANITLAFIAGTLLMALFLRVNSTTPGIVVHYLVDLASFY